MANAKKGTGTRKTVKKQETVKDAVEEVKIVNGQQNDEITPVNDEVKKSKEDEAAEEIKALREMIVSLQQQIETAKAATVQPVYITADTAKVHFLWQAEVADDNTVTFGENGMYGRIVGKTGSFYVPKSEISRLMDDKVRLYMQRRWLIVTDGLDDEERKALGVDYKVGEVLTPAAFANIVELGDELLNIYPMLCDGHKKIVAQRYHEAYANNSPYVTRERTVKLNDMSKTESNKKGDFYRIIEQMNAADATE